MKKSLSLLSAAVLTASCLSFTDTNANATDAAAKFYMKVPASDTYGLNDTRDMISIDSLDEDLTITAQIFFSNPTNSAWSVSPKWNSDSEYIKITNVNIPLEEGNLKEYAYAEKDENGNLTVARNGYDYSVNKNYGSHNFTVRSADGKALVPYGAESDSYELLSFDFTIDADTPDGTYEIFFTTDEDNSTRCAMDATQNHMIYKFPDNPPVVSGLKIVIGEGNAVSDYNIGDINLDGKVDSSDATEALSDYATMQTGGASSLNDQQKFNGDVNFDGSISSTDASDILNYYAYVSTSAGTPKSFLEYFERTVPEK
ncbi:MAG: hypothetical protein IKV85_10440 [Ruminococcus sp.]|nr:hypothetical protein [Ruminococcus sp.]